MGLSEVLNDIVYVVLTIILPIVATYVVNLIKAKINESTIISNATKNEHVSNIIKDAISDVMDAVLYVNQTYTDSLKASGKFDEEAQKMAFNKAYAKAVNLISEQTKEIITALYGSFEEWLNIKIESAVNVAKK